MRIGIRSLCLSLIVIAARAAEPDPPAKLSFPTNEDLRHYRSLNAPRLSPDGRNVLVRIADATADGAKSHLWLVNIEKNTSRQLTYSPDSDKAGELAGEWMPDGESILFLARRGEHKQLFQLPMAGGEAKPFELKVVPPVDASKLPNALPPVVSGAKPDSVQKPEAADQVALEPSAFAIAPDGKRIAFLASDPQTPGEKKQSDAKADANWVGHDLHGTRLYLIELATGKVTPVAVPIDVNHMAWAWDSSRLLAICEEPNGISDLSPASSTWTVQANQPANPVKIPELPATIQTAEWSLDGNSILFLAQAAKDTPPGYRDLFEYKLDSRAIQNHTGDFGGSVGFQSPIPLPGGAILLPVNQGVTASLLRFNPQAKPQPLSFATPVAGSFHTNAGQPGAKQTGWVFLGMGPGQPTTLFYASALDQPARVLNTPTLTPANNLTVASKRISWKSGSLTIEGLLYLPPQASGHKVPLIVEVHGGPLGAYLDDYSPFIQFLVGHGWAVLRTNPRGSSNYGAAFAAANKNDLGGGDYRDIMAGVDFVLKTEAIDAGRMALEGYSYGGEMAGFVEGKTSRFKAIISGAPVIDQYSEYGTENGSFYDRWYFGKPWEHPEDAWRQSPLAGASHATTPFLLLQGESDATDPLGQSQEMYRALKQTGVAVQLVTYPREDHGPLGRGIYGAPVAEPWHGFDARKRIVEFLEKEFGAAHTEK